MFPRFFNAQVAERIAVWGVMLGFLTFLYAMTEITQVWKLTSLAAQSQAATAAAASHAGSDAAVARIAGAMPLSAGSQVSVADLEEIEASLTMASTPAMPDEIRQLAQATRTRLKQLGAAAPQSDQPAYRALTDLMGKRAELGQALVSVIEATNARQAGGQ